MDNNSVEMQAKENNPKKNGRIAVCCCIVAAICIVVATVLVMHFRNSDGLLLPVPIQRSRKAIRISHKTMRRKQKPKLRNPNLKYQKPVF